MKTVLWMLVLLFGLAACAGNGTTVSVKTDSAGRELDTLGNKIEEKAAVVGDSVKAIYKDIKASVQAGIDSIKQAHQDTTH